MWWKQLDMTSSIQAYFSGFLIVFLCIPSGTFGNVCPSKINRERDLKTCLLLDYEKSVRPALSSDTIFTYVHMHLRVIEMDEHYHSLSIHAWISWEWTDMFLKWVPADYDGIETISIQSDDIWNPDVSLLTTGDSSMHYGIPSTYCKLKFTGAVQCIPPTTLSAHCAPDLTLWPFDTQTCTALIGSWTHFASALNLTLAGNGFTSDYMLPNKVWEVVSIKAEVLLKTFSGGNTFPSLLYTFVIKRHAAGHAATVVIPAFVLAVITLLIFLLDPESPERIALSGCSLLGHILFLQYMSWAVPPNGDNVPTLVVFFRDSLLLVGASLVVTVFARMLLRMQVSPPDWLNAVIGGVLATQPGQLFLLGQLSARGAAASASTAGEDGTTLVTDDASPSSGGGSRPGGERPWKEIDDTWRLAAIFVDRLAFSVFFIALVFLFGRYVA